MISRTSLWGIIRLKRDVRLDIERIGALHFTAIHLRRYLDGTKTGWKRCTGVDEIHSHHHHYIRTSHLSVVRLNKIMDT